MLPEEEDKNIDNVSIIFLSQNSESILQNKISFLLNEIDQFKNAEIIIVDDGSKDESQNILKQFTDERIKLLLKDNPCGIPDSMNLGIQNARFEHIVFCDKRQHLSKGIIKKLILPLNNPNIGMVSSCVSNYDKCGKYSLLRAHENFIKYKEGQMGNLMGVYGPLHAIRKDCYQEMPDKIILDDLYNTLQVLSKKQVVFMQECQIFDDDMDFLYNYKRTKRYFLGFIQILKNHKLLSALNLQQIIMLLWHKYLRIIIPILIFICYTMFGIKSISDPLALSIFSSITLIVILCLFIGSNKANLQINSFIRFITFYSFAFMEFLFITVLFKKLFNGK
ncbi:MAG: glycosyltransferase [Bacteroidales bacterium]|nr:glycosyltransferase [Bacteroidales bacterium]